MTPGQIGGKMCTLTPLNVPPHASKAFEITKMQEVSKQKEFQAEMEKQQTQRMQMSSGTLRTVGVSILPLIWPEVVGEI